MSPARFGVSSLAHGHHTFAVRVRRQLGRGLRTFFLSLLLLTSMLNGWGFSLPYALAKGHPHAPATPGTLTFQKFLQQSQQYASKRGHFVRPRTVPAMPPGKAIKYADYAHLPSSTEPPTMKPLTQPLAPSFLTNGAGATSLDLFGSDKRLEVLLQPGSLDMSQAITAQGTVPTVPFQLTLTQIHGHALASTSILGTYQLHITDHHGQLILGIHLRTPITLVYHYQPWELTALGLDASRLMLLWPTDTVPHAHNAAEQDLVLPLHNDPLRHTLTVQSSVLRAHPFDSGVGQPQDQSPPAPHFASVQGNAGQLTYAYPFSLPPGPGGFTPQLQLAYSTSNTNERHSFSSPADSAGDGWSVSLGSISAEEYPAGSAGGAQTWYFISGVDNVSDRLIFDPGSPNNTYFYFTEHFSHLRIQKVGNCFKVWDTADTYYEFGCTSDSVQYWTDGNNTQHIYRYDLDKMVSSNNGSQSTGKAIFVSYLQDSPSGSNSVRDAAIKQITYGTVQPPNSSTLQQVTGTIDFYYGMPTVPSGQGKFAFAYGTNYHCSSPPTNTTLRCDDPLDYPGGFPAPKVMSTLSLQSLTMYVGNDSSGSKAASYAFTYQDLPFTAYGFNGQQCADPTQPSQSSTYEYCAGEHLLTGMTPTMYQSGTGHTLKPVQFSYTTLINSYSDHSSPNPFPGGGIYGIHVLWQYMTAYMDSNTGVGGHITYATAYSNSHATPDKYDGQGHLIDDRHDPIYCFEYPGDCTGVFAYPDDRAWTNQIVMKITSMGIDSSSLTAATTTYNYRLQVLPNCSTTKTGNDSDCVSDTWIPINPGPPPIYEGDWIDFYHGEFRGFNVVYQLSPANELTADTYWTTDGWNTPNGNAGNYNGGHLRQEDVYSGATADSAHWLRSTHYTYTGDGTPDSCDGNVPLTYVPCVVMVAKSRTVFCENTDCGGSTLPWVETDYTYDDYDITQPSHGLKLGGTYHNLTKEVISSSNAPTITKSWTYAPNDSGYSGTGWIYYNVNKVVQQEIDDASGHKWQCQSFTYDENAPSGGPPAGTPGAGWLTTVNTYTNSHCTSPTPGSPWTTSYRDYDAYGNVVATVDGVATANSSLYGSSGTAGKNGCTLSSSPAIYASSWGKSNYTTCTSYDSYNAQVASTTDAFGQSSSMAYDYTQGALPKSATDLNGQVTTTAYNYDANSGSNNKITVSISQPGESDSFTSQSWMSSGCTTQLPYKVSNILPCFEIDSQTSQYTNAISQKFYDSADREIETSTPLPTPNGQTGNFYTVVLTAYNDSAHSVWKSMPFVVSGGSIGAGWIDSNGVKDYTGTLVKGNVTYEDALNRPLATQDALVESSTEPGISCTLNGSTLTVTTCLSYGTGQAVGDTTNYYATSTSIDANSHVGVSFTDALRRTRYVQYDSGLNGGTLTPNEQKSIQYNVLNEPISVTVTDETPQPTQTTTSVTTTAQYDDQGRLTQLADPDRGTHTYTYDADGHVLTDSSGTRTLGYNYDLLTRPGCVQDATPTINATGACSAGSPLVQNIYDSSAPGVTWGSTDYPKGRLTQSIATTYYPDTTLVTTTQSIQYDQRGRSITQQLQLGLPSGWNVTTSLPTYQMALQYNDANQLVTTTTSTIVSGTTTPGSITTQVYDSSTGVLTGLSNNTTAIANVASLTYNASALVGGLTLFTSAGSSSHLADETFTYDGDLRSVEATATWQRGSGSSGQIFDQNRWYDPVGNVASLATTFGASGSGSSEVQNFCYDEQDRLVWSGNSSAPPGAGNGTCGNQAFSSGLSGAGYTNSFVYTHLGQLWQGPLNGSSSSYQYLYCTAAPHQLSGLYPLGQTCANKSGQVYKSSDDAWGNETNRTYQGNAVTLAYDKEDRQVKWSGGTGTNEFYAYDASGSRVLRRSTSGGTTTLTVYAFGLEEHLYSGSGAPQNATYYYSLAGHLIGELIGSTAKTNIFLTDALGSVVATFSNIAGSAAVLGSQVYGPYGTQRYANGTMGTAKGFTGQYNDSLTGLDYYNARYYDPVVGVFLSADTVQGNLQGVNPYGYVGGNPETVNDPTGHYVPCPDGGCGGGSGGSSGNGEGSGENRGGGAGMQNSGGGIQQNSKPRPWFGQFPPFNKIQLWYNILRGMSGNDVAFNQSIAYLLALEVQAFRLYQPEKTNANYADGFFYITDDQGRIIKFGFMTLTILKEDKVIIPLTIQSNNCFFHLC